MSSGNEQKGKDSLRLLRQYSSPSGQHYLRSHTGHNAGSRTLLRPIEISRRQVFVPAGGRRCFDIKVFTSESAISVLGIC